MRREAFYRRGILYPCHSLSALPIPVDGRSLETIELQWVQNGRLSSVVGRSKGPSLLDIERAGTRGASGAPSPSPEGNIQGSECRTDKVIRPEVSGGILKVVIITPFAREEMVQEPPKVIFPPFARR